MTRIPRTDQGAAETIETMLVIGLTSGANPMTESYVPCYRCKILQRKK
jgi:hypothetical protein